MPWAETSPMQERVRFIADYRSGLYSMTELCEQFRVSRKTGYKWIRRFEEEGAEGLRDRSRAPYRCDHRIPDGVADDLVRVRLCHPTWGPKKLIAWCEARWPAVDWPATEYRRRAAASGGSDSGSPAQPPTDLASGTASGRGPRAE